MERSVEFAGKKQDLSNTTPDGVTSLNLFKDMLKRRSRITLWSWVRALVQDRAGFVPLSAGVITTCTHHLDYHRTVDGYVQAKLQILDRIQPNGFAGDQPR